MSPRDLSSISPVDLVAAAFSLPLFSLVVASLVTAAGLLVARRSRASRGEAAPHREAVAPAIAGRYVPERRSIAVGAVAVIVVYAIENVVRGYLLNLVDVVEWWQYATPVFMALISIIVVLCLIVIRGTTAPEQSVVQVARRNWASFGPRWGIVGGIAAMLALLTTTIAAGLASTPNERGRYIYLELVVPNVPIDALRPWFYGWSYGAPVLICLAGLSVVAWGALRSNAMRPFLRPDTVAGEQRARVETATGVVRIATAGTLLALAGAWRFIARSGSISQVTIQSDGQSDTYETAWRYAEFATAAGWLAPALEITAFVLLLLAASRLHRRHATSTSTVPEFDETAAR